MLKWLLVIIFVLWVIALWVVVGIAIMRGWGPYFRSKRQKKLRIYAKIASKQGRQEINPLTLQTEFTQKVLVFDCEDGVPRDYEVHDDIWDWVEVGDDGMLIYQGDLFVDFEARRPRHDHDKLYARLTRG